MSAALNRKSKGDLAELKVATDLIRRGYKVAFPYGEDWDFDVIVERSRKLERVQVKYAESDGSILLVRCQSNSLTNGKVRVRKKYTSETIDWLAVYDAITDSCYYVPAEELAAGMCTLTLRIAPTRNGQRLGIRRAAAYAEI